MEPTSGSVAEGSTSVSATPGNDNEGQAKDSARQRESTTIPALTSNAPPAYPEIPDTGLTELYAPPPKTMIVADVIFVHGLMGNPVDTWLYGEIFKSKTESMERRSFKSALGRWRRAKRTEEGEAKEAQQLKQPYCYWPLQLLPQDVKDIRVLTYGYDSYPTHWYKHRTNRMTITQHANDLLTKVTLSRSECRGRSLIFVAHSLGGILVKSALNESLQMQLQPAYADLQKSCRAVIFFGTPHLGANIAAWGEIMSNIIGTLPGGFSTYSEVLRGLSPDSETLDIISRRFNDLLNAPTPPAEKIQICSIQEGQGKTSIKGLGSKVVPDYSSKFNRTDIEQSFFIQDQNHRDMCKFSSAKVTGYQDFVKIMKGYRMAILEKLAALQQQQQMSNAAEHTALLKQLNFTDRLEREQQLNRIVTNEQSFEWVWNSNFVSWLRSPSTLFWIVGHPASGKSTLINHIAKSAQFNQILDNQFSSRVTVIRFFFDYRAVDGIRNTFQGFRRSLLYQILRESPLTTAAIEQNFRLKQMESHEWLGDDSMLKKILEYVLQQLQGTTFLFLDGLDEYNGEKPELISLIDSISAEGVKICLASRDENPFRTRLRHAPSFRMDELNRPGIEAYANALLASSLRPENVDEASSFKAFAKYIAKMSSGVFLWAHFAVLEIINSKGEDIINAKEEGRCFDKTSIDEVLRQLPSDLQKIYSRIFAAKRNQDKVKCGVTLRLITSARRTLQLSELLEASVLAGVHPTPASGTVQQADLASFERYTKALGGGLIELVPFARPLNHEESHRRCVLVKIIHRTLQTYLEEHGWKELLGEDEAAQPEDLTWLKVCSAFLQQKKLEWTDHVETFSTWNIASYREIDEEDLGRDRNPSRNILQLNLSDYVGLFLPQHASRFEKDSGTSSRPLIGSVLTASFLRTHALLYLGMDAFPECFKGMWSSDVPFVLISGAHLAVAHQLRRYVEEEISKNPTHMSLQVGTRNSTFDYPGDSDTYRPIIPPAERMEGPSLLETAVLCSSLDPSATRSVLVEYLAELSPRLNDEDMRMAIRDAPPSDLRALLRKFPPGRLQLTSKRLFHGHRHLRGNETFDVPQYFGPLWDVACRINDEDNAAELLGLFMERGEDINAHCGPYGTALNSTILCHIWNGSRYEDVMPMLTLFIEHGADPNVEGPEGNALELVWKLGNTSQSRKWRWAGRYTPIIRFLIGKGAVNQRCDPNGMIPTVERMLAFETWEDNYVDGKYYYYGTVVPEDEQSS